MRFWGGVEKPLRAQLLTWSLLFWKTQWRIYKVLQVLADAPKRSQAGKYLYPLKSGRSEYWGDMGNTGEVGNRAN